MFLAALVLSGCSGGSNGATDSAPAKTKPSNAASATTAAIDEPKWKVRNVVIQERAIDLYGQEAAEQGRDMAERLARDYSFNNRSIKYPQGKGLASTRRWMLGIRNEMTPDAAGDWGKVVRTYFAGDEFDSDNKMWGDIMSVTSYGLYEKGMYPAAGVAPMEDMTIKSLVVDLASDGRLWITMKSSATYNFLSDGAARQSVANRNQEMWLERIGGRWKIDGWNGDTIIKVVD